MVIHYPPARLRHNSDRPTAITNLLITTAGSSSRTGEVPLGTPTCSGPRPPGPLGAVPQRRPGRGHLAPWGPDRTTRRGGR